MASKRSQSADSDRGSIELQVPADEAAALLNERIHLGGELLASLGRVGTRQQFEEQSDTYYKWNSYNDSLLQRLFAGPIMPEYRPSSGIISVGPYSLAGDVRERSSDIQGYVRKLESIVERLPLWDPHPVSTPPRNSGLPPADKVFIVHGHDEAAKHEVARCLERLGIDAVILAEQPSGGRTLVEKLVHYSAQVGFAVVILSPDDLGASKSDQNDLKPRARQNVIFEMGYFIGLLGRERVCALLSGDLQRPGDIDGVVYVSMAGNWKTELANELKAAGAEIDMNRLR